MSGLDSKTQFYLEQILDETCEGLPNGGDHASRRVIAEDLLEAAQAGHTAVDELYHAARNALAVLMAKQRLRI